MLSRVVARCLPLGIGISFYVALMHAILPVGQVSVWGWAAQVLWLPGSHILAAGYMSGLAVLFLDLYDGGDICCRLRPSAGWR